MAEEKEAGSYPQMAKIVERNISALLNRRKEEEQRKNYRSCLFVYNEMDKWHKMFQKDIAKEEHHDDKSNKHDPASGNVKVDQVTDNNKIENGMQQDAK